MGRSRHHPVRAATSLPQPYQVRMITRIMPSVTRRGVPCGLPHVGPNCRKPHLAPALQASRAGSRPTPTLHPCANSSTGLGTRRRLPAQHSLLPGSSGWRTHSLSPTLSCRRAGSRRRRVRVEISLAQQCKGYEHRNPDPDHTGSNYRSILSRRSSSATAASFQGRCSCPHMMLVSCPLPASNTQSPGSAIANAC